jgi:hypothetical protein
MLTSTQKPTVPWVVQMSICISACSTRTSRLLVGIVRYVRTERSGCRSPSEGQGRKQTKDERLRTRQQNQRPTNKSKINFIFSFQHDHGTKN